MTEDQISDADVAFQLGKAYSKMEENPEFESKEIDSVKYAANNLGGE